MPLHVVCPECRSAYDLADEQRGKKVRCKKCANVFVAEAEAKPARVEAVREAKAVAPRPDRDPPKAVVPVAPRRASARDDEDDDREVRRRPAPPKKSGNLGTVLLIGGLAFVALIVLVGGIGLIVGLRWLTKDDAAPANSTPVIVNRQPFQPNPAENAPVIKPADNKPPEENVAARFPTVRDDPEDANADAAPAANGELAPVVLRKVKRRTALILVTVAEGHASGTGFFAVEDNVLLTNAHVLGMLNPEAEPPKTIDVVVDSGEKDEQKFGAQILAVDRESDLAVLRVILRPGQASGTIPKPLEVKPASDLLETQKVYVFGFPFGPQIGEEITVSTSQVSSFRKDSTGKLVRVQVNGGMQPGNSGGPVVNANGQVIGVAVSVIRNTPINFAIPGERVRGLFQGRIKEKSFGQPYIQDSKVIMPVSIHMVDPLQKITDVSLDIWTGDANKPRPAVSGETPKQLPGDSDHLVAKLAYRIEKGKGKVDAVGVATSDIVLPPLPSGKFYYVQPSWVKGENGTREWDRGVVLDTQPVERKSAKLVLQQQKGERILTLETDRFLDIHGAGPKELSVYHEKFGTQIRERTIDVGNTGAKMQLQYSNATLVATGESRPDETGQLKNLPANL
ncbi:MAG TPA: trypsin-like peptidase domain-containing protein, partial [Gemmataceae bacterium]